jgi:Flp pilus assembly protein TadB
MPYKIVKSAIYAYLQSKEQRERIDQHGVPEQEEFRDTVLIRRPKDPKASTHQIKRLLGEKESIQETRNAYFKDILVQRRHMRKECKRSTLSACFAGIAGAATYMTTQSPILSMAVTLIPGGFLAYFGLRFATAMNTEHNLTAHYESIGEKIGEIEGQIKQLEKDRDWGIWKTSESRITPPNDPSIP